MYRYICIVREIGFHFLVDSTYFTAVLDSQKNWMVKDFLYNPYLPMHAASSTVNILHHSDTFVTIDELMLIHQYQWYDDTSLPLKVHSLHEDWFFSLQFSHVVVSDSATPWTAARQPSRSTTNSQSPPKPLCIELVMPSNHLILCHPLLLLPSIFPNIRVFSNESALCIR